jgi:hypothetical protein
MSHNRTLPSLLPVARILPSGLSAIEETWPASTVKGGPAGRRVATSHNRTVPSVSPVASVLPSELNATQVTLA